MGFCLFYDREVRGERRKEVHKREIAEVSEHLRDDIMYTLTLCTSLFPDCKLRN